MSPSTILEELERLAAIRNGVSHKSKNIIDTIIEAQLKQLKETLLNGKS